MTVTGINIDQIVPTVHIAGVHNGAVYPGPVPHARCVAHDALSGTARCVLVTSATAHGKRLTATVTDRAGNSTTSSVTYRVLTVYLVGAKFVRGAFDVRVGTTYTVVALAATRPQYYDAAVYPQRPNPVDAKFHQTSRGRWALGVLMDRGMRTHRYWNIGVKIGRHLYATKVRVI